MEDVIKMWNHDPDDDDDDDDDDLGYTSEPENWEEDALSLQSRTEQDTTIRSRNHLDENAPCPFFNLPREVVEQLAMLRVEEWLNMVLDGMNAQIRGGTYIDQPNTFRLGQEDEGFIDDPNRQQEEEQEEQEQEEEDKREGAEGGQEDDDQSLHSSDSDPSLHSDNSKELGIDFSKQAPP